MTDQRRADSDAAYEALQAALEKDDPEEHDHYELTPPDDKDPHCPVCQVKVQRLLICTLVDFFVVDPCEHEVPMHEFDFGQMNLD